MKKSKASCSTILMVAIAMAAGVLFSTIPTLSGFAFGGAFSLAVIELTSIRWGHLTLGSIITKERYTVLTRWRLPVMFLLLLIVVSVPIALMSNSFILGFLATPGVFAIILFSGLMVGAANSYGRETQNSID